ncbi:MAG: hypothetical protein RL367_2873 [Pseudomonadota bacterium]
MPHADSLVLFCRKGLTALLCSQVLIAPVAAAPVPFETQAPIAYLVDLSSGAVLYARQADKRMLPASMAKMMTVYLAFKLIRQGTIKMTNNAIMRPEIWAKWSQAGSDSTMYIGAGERVSVENLLHGITTVSGNDASEMLAEGIAGNQAAYVALMNRESIRLGLRDTRFGTVTGWPDAGRTWSTAHDLADLGRATLYDFPDYYRQFYGKPEFTWGHNIKTGKGISQPNRNPILGRIAGADGIKTGHTAEAGFCLAGSAEQNGRRLIMIVAGLPSERDRASDSVALMDWGFKAWQNSPLVAAGKRVGAAKVQLGSSATVGLIAPRAVGITRPAGTNDAAKVSYSYNGPIRAPIAKGQHIADLVTIVAGLPPQVTPLLAENDVPMGTFLGRVWAGFMSFFG